MSEKRILQLISKKLAGEASATELAELEGYLAANPEQRYLYDLLSKPIPPNEDSRLKAEQAYGLHQLKKHIYHPIEGAQQIEMRPKKERLLKLKRYTLVAAALLVVFASMLIFKIIWMPATKIEVTALKGSKTNITLPDGTLVWLNSDSKINYRNDFPAKQREIWLSGEAFFDVKHDANHPFIIHTAKINIKVLGTAFNVKSYPNDSYTETSLVRGKIDVNFITRPDEHIIMHPNEKLTVRDDLKPGASENDISINKTKISLENIQAPTQANQIAETAWMHNRIIFNDTEFSEIANVLERRFDVTITFTNPQIKRYRFTGTFEDENLVEILKLMKITKPFNYELNKKQLNIN